MSSKIDDLDVAVIGMAGRFPGARNVEEYWSNLCQGVHSVSTFTDDELLEAGVDAALVRDPAFVKARGIVEDADLFDAAFFGFHPRDAELMDPQHRVFLEVAWEALENAGYDPERFPGLVGLFGGTDISSYLLDNLLSNIDTLIGQGLLQSAMIGNVQDTLTTRVAYKFNLRGPCYTLQTNCSTSLVAIHVARQSLLSYECDLAMAGGVVLSTPLKTGYFFAEGGMTSPDGRCRAFDADAAGAPFSNGCGLVVLRRLTDALEAGDRIYAVIKGSAINNDGSQRVGYTAPGVKGQAEVIAEALSNAGVEPESINYIETHGTGTIVGDPIEVAALTRVFGDRPPGSCLIGSVKPNIGHMDRAAGVGSFIKLSQALDHKQLPPTIHYQTPNPELKLDESPFQVNTELRDWPKQDGWPRRADVSAFGVGGTNAHLILEEAPERAASSPSRPAQLLLLSARTETALDAMSDRLAEHLETSDDPLADVAFTLQVGRRTFNHRRMLVASSGEDAAEVLRERHPRRLESALQERERPPIAFLFAGLGDQYLDMGRELYESEAVFQQAFDQCADLLQEVLATDIRAVVYPPRADRDPQPETDAPAKLDLRRMMRRAAAPEGEAERALRQTAVLQPLLFSFEFALARLWASWGIEPQAMFGYSLGEYVAACLAGVMSLPDAVRVVAERARLIDALESGSMLSIALPEEETRALLTEGVSIAAINGSALTVVSGRPEAVDALAEQLAKDGIACQPLATSHAFHSEEMRPIVERYVEFLSGIELKTPQKPYLSNVTGTWIRDEEATDPRYYARHLCEPVRFADAIAELWREPGRILLEIGPGQSLCSLALQLKPAEAKNGFAQPSLRHAYESGSDVAFLLTALGHLWLAGAEVDWQGFYAAETRQRRPLPTYPFERQRYWVDRKPSTAGRSFEERLEIDEWFSVPVWKQSVKLPNPSDEAPVCWWVFVDDLADEHETTSLGEAVIDQLQRTENRVIAIRRGLKTEFDGDAVILGTKAEDYELLVKMFEEQDALPDRILHLWSLRTPTEETPLDRLDRAESAGFYSLFFLAQAFGKRDQHVEILALSNNVFDVLSGEALCPEQSTLWGPCRVIPKEYPNLNCQGLDLDLRQYKSADATGLASRVVAEFPLRESGPALALRGDRRWQRDFDAAPLPEPASQTPRLRQNGVYLITGGLGGLGLALAEHLARTVDARLILTGRRQLPERSEWDALLTSDDETTEDLRRKIRQVRDLEALGAEVLTAAVDAADEAGMRALIDQARQRFGTVHGVFHVAGIPGGGVMAMKEAADAAEVLAVKVRGTLVLERVFAEADEKPDFFVLYSAALSILGGLGEVDYCAANGFLDAFSHYQSARGGIATAAINWCQWQWDAWQEALLAALPELQANMRRMRETFGLSFDEGHRALERVLDAGQPQVVVATQDLTALMEAAEQLTATAVMQEIDPLSATIHPRPATLRNPFVAPATETEERIAAIWREMLGLEEVGIHDPFFELGGHSLLGTQLIGRVRDTFQIDLPLRILFEAPTVHDLSLTVEEALIAEIENLGEEEMAQLAISA